jgi:hypothetical protein
VLAKLELHQVQVEYGELSRRAPLTEAERVRYRLLEGRIGELKGTARVGTLPPV